MRYFLYPSCIRDLSITKKEVHMTTEQIIIQLYSHCDSGDSTEAEIYDYSKLRKLETIMKLYQIFIKVNH